MRTFRNKISLSNSSQHFFFFVVGVSYQGWLEKCSKDEIRPPLPLKVENILTPTLSHTISVITSYYNVALKYNYKFISQKLFKMANRVMYDKMLEEDMFPHLLALNPPNLVEIQPKQNLLRIFL